MKSAERLRTATSMVNGLPTMASPAAPLQTVSRYLPAMRAEYLQTVQDSMHFKSARWHSGAKQYKTQPAPDESCDSRRHPLPSVEHQCAPSLGRRGDMS